MRWFDNFDVHGLGRNCNVQTLFMRVVPRQFFQAVLLTQFFPSGFCGCKRAVQRLYIVVCVWPANTGCVVMLCFVFMKYKPGT